MNRNILNLRQLTVLLILCTAFLGGIIPAFAQQGGKKITGQVIDENKEPMIGVSILIVGTSTGTVTDFDGNYTLNVPQGNKELQFSYVGYETKIVALPTSGSVLNVQMKSDSQVLSDVVVIGYGTQRKSDLTGSVTNVSSKDFNMGLVSSPEQLINGKISGCLLYTSPEPTRPYYPCAWRCLTECQQRPVDCFGRCSFGTGWYQRERRKLSEPHQPERH